MTEWTDQQPEPGYRDHPGFASWLQGLATQPSPATAQGRRIREMQLALDRRNEALAAADARNHLLEEQLDVQEARITVLTESNRLLRAQLDEQTANRDAAAVYAASLHAAYVPPPRQRLTRQHATRLTRQRARDTALLAMLLLGGAALVVCGLLVLGAGFAALRAWGQ